MILVVLRSRNNGTGDTMAKAVIHAQNSVRRYGGVVTDYIAIHEKMDETKKCFAKVAHRCIFHSAYGVWLIEEIFGRQIRNSAGKDVSVRGIAEDHVLEDLGFIPSLDDWLKEIPSQPWMAGARATKIKVID